MKKLIIAVLLSLPLGLLLVTVMSGKAQADEAVQCPTQYGAQYGQAPCPANLQVNKLVRNPITGVFVENLLRGDAAYSPRSEIIYELRITNSSNTDFDSVQVTDTVEPELTNPRVVDPSLVETIETPDKQTLRFVIRHLKASETRSILIKAEVVSGVSVAQGDDRKCEITNFVKVETSGQQPDEDTADLCVILPGAGEVLGAKAIPEAGVSDVLPLVPFMGMGISGIALFLKRK